MSERPELLNFGIVLLQETHISCPKQAKAFERSWRGKCYWSFGTGKSAGVAVLLPPHFSGSVQRFLFDSDGRTLSLLFIFGPSSKLNVINIYAPNLVSDRKTFFEQIHDFFLSRGDYIIAGDFNCVDHRIDKFQADNVLTSDKNCLAALKTDFSLFDVNRKLNPRGISFTWSNKNNTQASRLNRFFISQSLLNVVCSNRVLPCTFSDHDFICLELGAFSTRHCGIWKFNTNLLKDSDFRQSISTLISDQKSRISRFDTLGDWWDNLKFLIRKSCVDFSARKRRVSNRSRSLLTKQLIRAKRDFHSGIVNDDSTIKYLQNALSALVLQEAEGAKIRSRGQWIKEGEKPTRYFFRLENKRAAKNSFFSLFDVNGVEKSTQSDFENILTSFYTDLFTKYPSIDMQIQTKIIDDLKLSLTDLERDSCEGLISTE